MTYSCSKVLKELRKLTKNTDETLSFASNGSYICLFYNPSVYFDYSQTKYSEEIWAIINELNRTQYIQLNHDNTQFNITYKGLHPYQVGWENIKLFLYKSVFVPIVISTITALITLWLRGLL